MTDPYQPAPAFTLARQFQDAMTDEARDRFKLSGVQHLPLLQAAADRGWLMPDLAVYCTTKMGGSIRDFTAIATHRMQLAATTANPRPAATAPTTGTSGLPKYTQPRPWCRSDLCQENGRYRLDPDTYQPVGRCDCWTAPPR